MGKYFKIIGYIELVFITIGFIYLIFTNGFSLLFLSSAEGASTAGCAAGLTFLGIALYVIFAPATGLLFIAVGDLLD